MNATTSHHSAFLAPRTPGSVVPAALIVGWLFLALALATVQYTLGHAAAEAHRQTMTDLEDQTRRDLEIIQRSLTPGRQAGWLFQRMVERTQQQFRNAPPIDGQRPDLATMARTLRRSYHTLLRPLLFDGTEICAVLVRDEAPIRTHHPANDPAHATRLLARFGTRLGLTPLAASLSAHLAERDINETATAQATTTALPPAVAAVQRKLGDVLHQDMPLTALPEIAFRQVRELHCASGSYSLYWDRINLPRLRHHAIIVIAVIDMQKLPPEFARRVALHAWDSRSTGLAFPARRPRVRTLASPFWRAHPQGRNLTARIANSDKPLWVETGNDYLAAAVHATRDAPFDVAILRTLPSEQGRTERSLRFLIGMLSLALATITLGEVVILRRRWGISLSTRIVGAFLLAGFLPLTSGHLVASEIFRQTLLQRTGATRQEMRDQFVQIDRGLSSQYGVLLRLIEHEINAPAFIGAIERAEQQALAGNRAPYERVVAALFRRITRLAREEQTGRDPLRSVMVSSDRGVVSIRLLQEGTDPEIRAMHQRLAHLFAGLLHRLRNPVAAEAFAIDSRSAADNMITDFIQKYLIGMTLSLSGADSLLDMLYFGHRVAEVRSAGIRTSFLPTNVVIDGRVRFMMLWTWESSDQTDRPYLRNRLGIETPRHPDRPMFALRWNMGQAIPRNLGDWPAVKAALLQCHETLAPITAFDDNHPGGLLIEAMPCPNMNAYAIAGAVPFHPLLTEQAQQIRAFWLAAIALLLLTALMAMGAASVFTIPIRALTRAVQRVSAGHYDTRLEIPGANEFGSLAHAFNTMCRGLEEGQILGRFVSESARQAAREGNLDVLAGEARQTSATVVFIGLTDFDDLRNKAIPFELVELLESHLERATEAARRNEGEIDKILGEKIMVVFDHARCGGARQAAAKAISMAWQIVHDARRDERRPWYLPPAIGINSGPVLAGILGAPTVRLDYTVIGDTVNLAARLATMAQITEGSRIVISGNTLSLAPEGVSAQRLPFTRVKGKTQEVEAFILDRQ